MSRLKALAGVALIFACGAVVGGMGGAKWMERRVRSAIENDATIVTELITRRLSHALKLNSDQRKQVGEIASEGRKKLENLRRAAEPEFGAILEEIDRKIVAILDKDQARKFEELRRKRPELQNLRTNP